MCYKPALERLEYAPENVHTPDHPNGKSKKSVLEQLEQQEWHPNAQEHVCKHALVRSGCVLLM